MLNLRLIHTLWRNLGKTNGPKSLLRDLGPFQFLAGGCHQRSLPSDGLQVGVELLQDLALALGADDPQLRLTVFEQDHGWDAHDIKAAG